MEAKPFLHWAGGKKQLINQIKEKLPKNIDTYIEPFIGGGAVLFYLLNNYPDLKKIIINDINKDLINSYRTVRDNIDDLIVILEKWQTEFNELIENNKKKKKYYYKKRTLFNKRITNTVMQSALLIFLNKTCFNGLYRVNSKNEFNVPIGSKKNNYIYDKENLLAVSKILQKVEILDGDFEQTLSYAKSNTLFYFDPPYKPISKTSNFTFYAKGKFTDIEQVRLANFCKKIDLLGFNWILSNSDAKEENSNDSFFDKLFTGFNIDRILARRDINCNGKKRGKINELLITNSI